MAKHKISRQRLQELLDQKADYQAKLERKHEQIYELITSTIDYASDPTYNSLLERKECYSAKLAEINDILAKYELIEHSDSCEVVEIGKKVIIKNHTHEHEFVVVDEFEADPSQSLVPADSPIGKSVMGKKLNDSFVVQTPRGMIDYQIISIAPAF